MKKNTLLKIALVCLFLPNITIYSQNFKSFTPRYNADVRGDILMIGNNTLNRNTASLDPNDPFNGTGMNANFSMEFIDLDLNLNTSTFCSSAAVLDLPSGCTKIAYAGLYWSAVLQSGSRVNIDKVKLQLPTGAFNDIIGEVIYDANLTPMGNEGNKPYACYADVTNLVKNLANPEGTYTVANVLSSQGSNGGSGLSAGWTLFVVYENPILPTKAIVSFDGFTGLSGPSNYNISLSGIRTPLSGPVRVKYAMATLEGDKEIIGDYLNINNTTISTAQRPADNFFNSTMTTPTGFFTARTPSSGNTLGLDMGVFNLNNQANALIANNDTSVTVNLGNTTDHYYNFFNAFAIELNAPKIIVTTIPEDSMGNPLSGSTLNLGQQFDYAIEFRNTGNVNITSFTIRNVIPNNVIFNPSNLVMPLGVEYTYNPSTRTLIFTIPHQLVEVGDMSQEIRVGVSIPITCETFANACSNFVENQSFATYQGMFDSTLYLNEPSFNSYDSCEAEKTKNQVDISTCDFTKEVTLICGANLTLMAADGYTDYLWSGPGTITPVLGTNNQQVEISESGTYTVENIITAPCVSIEEVFNVEQCLNTEVIKNFAIKLYPNPISDQFFIDGNITVEKLDIYNLLGQKIKTYVGNKREYSTNQLVSGTYIVKIQTEKGTSVNRIIKQ